MHNKIPGAILKVLHLLEIAIVVLTIIVLVFLLFYEAYSMFTVDGYFDNASTFLHSMLTIVVGIEFVKTILDPSSANVIQMLILAISRHVVISHSEPLSNIVCVLCIAALYAVQRFLVPRDDVYERIAAAGKDSDDENGNE